VPETPGVVSIYVTGRDLDRLAVRSGQYFVWRFLTRNDWWRAHPFSISSAPNGEWLRITVKALGDWSTELQRVAIGTRVFIEGPYGAFTGARRTRPRVLLVAGGIGIAPLRALLEALPANRGDLTLLYRVRSPMTSSSGMSLRRWPDARGDRSTIGAGSALTPPVPSLARLCPHPRARRLSMRTGPDDVTRRGSAAAARPACKSIHQERFAFRPSRLLSRTLKNRVPHSRNGPHPAH
jgi:ferredoxin-NADP reductase